eukprot:gene5302-7074_t
MAINSKRAIEDFLTFEQDYAETLLVLKARYLDVLVTASWFSQRDRDVIVSPLQRIAVLQQHLWREMSTLYGNDTYSGCPISHVLSQHAVAMMTAYSRFAALLPTSMRRYRELLNNDDEDDSFRQFIEQRPSPPTLYEALHLPTEHISTYPERFAILLEQIRKQDRNSHQRQKKCQSYLEHLANAISSITYLKSAERGLFDAKIENWEGPALENCGYLLLTSRVLIRNQPADAGSSALILLLSKRIVVIEVIIESGIKRYSMVKSFPFAEQDKPLILYTANEKTVCLCTDIGVHTTPKTSSSVGKSSSKSQPVCIDDQATPTASKASTLFQGLAWIEFQTEHDATTWSRLAMTVILDVGQVPAMQISPGDSCVGQLRFAITTDFD